MHKNPQQKPVRSFMSALMVILMVLMPLQGTLLAQDLNNACGDGQNSAKADISGGTWFIAGCFLGPLVYLIGLQPENPPATNLLGKPPEYVAAFTDCYRNETKRIKSSNALTGCLIGSIVQIGLYVAIIASADSLEE